MVAETWIKKFSLEEFLDIAMDHFHGEQINWDLENNEFISHEIEFIYDGVDYQKNCNVWIDDNNKGYFFSELRKTSGGTPIVRHDDNYSVRFYFQLKSDAEKFIEIANDKIACKILWSN